MSPLLKRLAAGMTANTYGQLVNIVIQLASLPIFLHYWDLTTYGVWLTVVAIPAYLSMADVGMVTVAANRMTMFMGDKNPTAANKSFQSAQFFLIISISVISLLVILAIFYWPFEYGGEKNIRSTIFWLVFSTMLSLAGGLFGAVFKATQRYATGAALDSTIRLLEWIGGMVGLMLYGDFLAVAVGMAACRFVLFVLVAYASTKGQKDLTWGVSNADLKEVKEMIKPSIGFMAFPIGNALSFQGFTLLAANFLGPASVAIFNTYRTLARVAVQVTSIFSHALWPEFSRLYGAKNFDKLKVVFNKSVVVGFLSSVGLSAFAYFAAPWMLDFWTHGKIIFQSEIIVIFLIYAAVCGGWHIPRILLMATNSHSALGGVYLVVSAVSLVLAWLLVGSYEIYGLSMAMMLGEFLMLCSCFYMALVFVKNKLKITGIA